jgi:DNA-binding transcriptional ArsR family regulator
VTTYALALDALGDGTRREILERLRQGPRAVGDLASELPVSRPAVSQHLRVLKEAGLVRDHAVGTRRIYEVNPEGFGQVRTWFEDFWTDALDAFKRAAEGERSDR